jgi:hypothetical protein
MINWTVYMRSWEKRKRKEREREEEKKYSDDEQYE